MRSTPPPWWAVRPPWEWPGLPWDLRPQDLADADMALTTGEPRGRVLPPWEQRWSSRLYATERPPNAARIAALTLWPPRRERQGWPVHPVLLAPDPWPTDHAVWPVAVIGGTGYLGSIWNDLGTAARPAIDAAAAQGRFYAAEVVIEGDARRWDVRMVWPRPPRV